MKKTSKRLQLNRETLNKTQLERVSGGSIANCPRTVVGCVYSGGIVYSACNANTCICVKL